MRPTTTGKRIDDRPTTRVSRAVIRLAAATAVSSTAVVLAADVAHARIALNHNESAGRDRRRRGALEPARRERP